MELRGREYVHGIGVDKVQVGVVPGAGCGPPGEVLPVGIIANILDPYLVFQLRQYVPLEPLHGDIAKLVPVEGSVLVAIPLDAVIRENVLQKALPLVGLAYVLPAGVMNESVDDAGEKYSHTDQDDYERRDVLKITRHTSAIEAKRRASGSHMAA